MSAARKPSVPEGCAGIDRWPRYSDCRYPDIDCTSRLATGRFRLQRDPRRLCRGSLALPDDLAQALLGYPGVARNFDAFPRSAKRGILEWIANARTAPTRSRRIDETARLAGRNERANQWRPKLAQ